MNAHAPAHSVHDIKVITFDAASSGQGIRIAWLNSAGEACTVTRLGMSADQLIAAVHAATLEGERVRHGFLVGFIRGLTDRGGLDD